jgi:hypothetical protein
MGPNAPAREGFEPSISFTRALGFGSLFFTNGLDEFCKVLGDCAIFRAILNNLCSAFRSWFMVFAMIFVEIRRCLPF